VSQSSEPEEVEATVTSIRDAATAAAAGMPARKRGAAAAARAKMPRLESFSDMPDYLRDNEFIFGSYRPQQSLWSSLRTLWGLHNETGNVWTHLLGGRRCHGSGHLGIVPAARRACRQPGTPRLGLAVSRRPA
jgi:adiponectin receptor